MGKPLLHKDCSGAPRKASWHYRSTIGMLGYLRGTSRPEILIPIHQCAWFLNNPMLSHKNSVKRIFKYLSATADKGIIYKPNKEKGIECYADADFAGSWNLEDTDDASNILS
mgnify:CR=1 FL=1